MSLIFVDCEGHGAAAGMNNHAKFEFGAVEYKTRQRFHGPPGCALGNITWVAYIEWLRSFGPERPIFVSDNVAYDWQFINYYLIKWCNNNPHGHSGRRIGDFAAGLKGDFYARQDWKKLRVTDHDHNPVHDAQGNAEAFQRLLKGEGGYGQRRL